MTTQAAYTYQGWTGGESGSLSPREAGRQKEMFHGNNVVRNRDALLIPRAGMRDIGITGLPNGAIRAGGGGSDGQWVLIGSTVYSFSTAAAGGAASAYTMTDSITDTPGVPFEVAGFFTGTYVFAFGTNVYKLNHGTKTCVKLTGGTNPPPPGRLAQFYQNRLLVAGDGTNNSRLFYSDPGAFDSFPSGNYLDLDGLGAITSIDAYRSGVLIGGLSGVFIYITGVIGFSEVVRTVTAQGAPADPTKRCLLATNEILYMAFERPYVETFNGAITTPMPTLTFASRNYAGDIGIKAEYRAVKMIGPDDWLFMSGITGALSFGAAQRAMLHYEGVATFHTWEKLVDSWAWYRGGGVTVLGVDGDSSHPSKFYWWDTERDRPAYNTDTFAQPGDGTDTAFTSTFAWLPEVFPEDGTEVIVRRVIVDFATWITGASNSKHFEVTVYAVNRYGTVDTSVADPLASGTQAWDEANTTVPTLQNPVDRRISFGFGEQGSGSGFRVHIDNIRAVGIRSVTVIYEKDDPRA